jgi:uncharacterized protein YbdZ (MbtH family)
MTLLLEICSVHQIWTIVWLMKHQKETISMYRKFKFIELRPKICSVGQLWTIVWQVVNEHIEKFTKSKTLWPEICSLGQFWTTLCLMKNQESISTYGKFKFMDSSARHIFNSQIWTTVWPMYYLKESCL